MPRFSPCKSVMLWMVVATAAVWSAATVATEAADETSERHWSFQPLNVVEPPEDPSGWSTGPIDRFIAAGLRERGLMPSGDAERRVLIRRAYLDLIGLLPTPEEVEDFVAAESPDAFARVVDRLLESPHYGERWGRHWLDAARYGDTSGDGADAPIPEAHLYRDYVIDAFNDDMPYDRFIIEQLAGDLLARGEWGPRWRRQIIATGFVALSRRYDKTNNNVHGKHLMIGNTIDTVGKALLGMSLSCARCHDHKFDPISQKEYYALYGFFGSTRYPHPGTEHGKVREGFVPLTNDPGQFDRWIEFDRKRHKLFGLGAGGDREDRRKNREEAEQLYVDYADVADLPVAYAVIDQPADKIGDAKLQKGGEPRRGGDTVARGAIECILPGDLTIPEGQSGRLQLAHWIASPENPLTARVMVNRIWLGHFGHGLVPTAISFGTQGESPTFPRLLDWLADRFIADGWSIKQMHRRIMLSRVYRMSSIAADGETAEADPDALWHSRYPSRRLEAEAIRDITLVAAQRLNLTRPGPHPFPETDNFGRVRFTQHRKFEQDYDHQHRSIYLMHRRLGKSPYMSLFDGPDPNESRGARFVSTVPLQALFFMNNEMVHQSALALAERAIRETGDLGAAIERAYMVAYGRRPDERELADAAIHLASAATQLTQGLTHAEREQHALASLCRVLLASNEFVYIE